MKNFKHLLVILVLVSIPFFYAKLPVEPNNLIWKIIPIVLISLFLFNLLVRKVTWFKPYFTSKFNLFTTKFRMQKEFDIPKELMFQKLIEVIKNSNFKIVNVNEVNNEIFATSPFSLMSWGENLYIDFQEEKENTVMYFCSVTLFQIYSWGKNEQNYNKLVNDIEESLII